MSSKPNLRDIKKKLKEDKKLTQKEKTYYKRKMKDNAWTSFSTFIRTRDCIRFQNSLDKGMCVTCGKVLSFKQLQAGHFISSRKDSVLFEEDIVHTQCYACNVGRSGNYAEYALFMLDEGYTRDEIEEMISRKYNGKSYSVNDYIDIDKLYKEKTEKLIKEFKSKDELESDTELVNDIFS